MVLMLHLSNPVEGKEGKDWVHCRLCRCLALEQRLIAPNTVCKTSLPELVQEHRWSTSQTSSAHCSAHQRTLTCWPASI
jgi:hypothetical protein